MPSASFVSCGGFFMPYRLRLLEGDVLCPSLRGCLAAVAIHTMLQKTYDVQMSKQPAVYIMANKCNGTLYTGVTSDLVKLVWQHQ